MRIIISSAALGFVELSSEPGPEAVAGASVLALAEGDSTTRARSRMPAA